MEIVTFLADILKYTCSGMIVLFVAWFLLRTYLDKRTHDDLIELRRMSLKDILPLRLQAYERAILFLERINPTNMLVRLHTADMTALEMQQVILSDIRAEFQHNVTQQLYISNHSWSVVKKLMEDTISMINNTMNTLPDNASALVLSKTVLSHLERLEIEDPYDMALTIIKRDIQQLF